MKHWIAMAGLSGGYVPNFCDVAATREEAIEILLQIHDIDTEVPTWWLDVANEEEMELLEEDRALAEELGETGYADLNMLCHGNEYMEVFECICPTPWYHGEDSSIVEVLERLDVPTEEIRAVLDSLGDQLSNEEKRELALYLEGLA